MGSGAISAAACPAWVIQTRDHLPGYALSRARRQWGETEASVPSPRVVMPHKACGKARRLGRQPLPLAPRCTALIEKKASSLLQTSHFLTLVRLVPRLTRLFFSLPLAKTYKHILTLALVALRKFLNATCEFLCLCSALSHMEPSRSRPNIGLALATP